jgi:hypothetical protein
MSKKSKYGARPLKLVANEPSSKKEDQIAVKEAESEPQPPPEPLPVKAENQTSGNQIDVKSAPKPKKPKTQSAQVRKWRAQKAFQLDQKITNVMTKNPKHKGAADRFMLYEEGQTVQEYIEKSHAFGNAKALAMADIRWDHVAGFIKVV